MFASTEREVLYEGVANSGKTRALLEKAYAICTSEDFSGVRMLWVRKTRKSLTESVLVTWEERVLPPNHPCITGVAKRDNRNSYTFPKTGAHIVLGGMDNPDRIMSTEYDFVFYFEATEGDLDDWEKLLTRSRNKRCRMGRYSRGKYKGKPFYWHQMIADCNPGPAFHWLNKRAIDGKMRRIKARHSDNPTFDANDQAALDDLTGARHKRLALGLWVSEEGQIWEVWDADTMMCYRKDLLINAKRPTGGYRFDWMFASLDFGKVHAQVFQVWGVIGDTIYRVSEIYRRGMTQVWWGDAIARQMQRWELHAIVADGGGLGVQLIDYLNDRLGPLGNLNQEALVIPARKGPNSRILGFQMVEDKMSLGQIMLCHDAQEEGACPISLGKYKPTCTEQEIEAFVWKKHKDGQPIKEDSDPLCDDDGCFAMIYACDWFWGRDLTDEEDTRSKPGTMGDLMDHDEVFAPAGFEDEHSELQDDDEDPYGDDW